MKKAVKKILFLLFISIAVMAVTGICANAAEPDEILEDFNSIIPDGVDVSTDELESKIGIDAVLSEVIAAFTDKGSEMASFFLLLLGYSVLLSLVGSSGPLGTKHLGSNAEIAVCTVASVSIFSALYGVASTIRTSLLTVTDFFASLIPIITVINTSGGALSSAGVQATNMTFTLAILEKFCTGTLMPICFAIFSLAFVGTLGVVGVSGVSRGVRSFFTWGVGIVSAILAATVAMQGVVASAADNAALRAARYAATSLIPMVGSSVASAISTLGGGLAFVKGTVGVGAVAVILIVTLAPLVSLLLYRLAFSLSLIFLEFSGADGGVRTFSSFRSALDSLIAVYSMSVLVCVVELIVFLMGGVGG